MSHVRSATCVSMQVIQKNLQRKLSHNVNASSARLNKFVEEVVDVDNLVLQLL